MWRAVLLATALMAGAAAADVQLKPPAEYDYPFHGEVVINYVQSGNVRRQCGHPDRAIVRACARVESGKCIITLAVYAKISSRQMLIRHETAHCNGWKHE